MTVYAIRRRRALFAAAVFGALAGPASAQNGTWTNPAGGSWPVAGNWLGNVVADGSGSIANFGTLDLAADATVTLDGSRSIGSLIFNDTTPSNAWTLAPGIPANGVLTLAAGGQPSINVSNTITTISVTLGGTQGVVLSGNGTLNLTGSNIFTGPVEIQSGSRMRVNNSGGSGTGGGNVTVKGGGKLGGGGTVSGGVTVDPGGTVAPGNSAGTLRVGSAEISGRYEFELTGSNYVTGAFNSGKSTNPLTDDFLNITAGDLSLLSSGQVQVVLSAAPLDPSLSYSWSIASVPAGSNINLASVLAVDTSLAPFFAGGDTRLSINGKILNLNYTPVPEPTTVLGIAGVFLAGWRTLRRWRWGCRAS